MITYSTENIWHSIYGGQSDTIVIPVNTVGVMGAGLAKQFAKRYPTILADYKEKCNTMGAFEAGDVYEVYINGVAFLLAATKAHYRNPSEIIWIENCIKALRRILEQRNKEKAVSVPALGCGLGGLEWNDVKALYEKYLAESEINFICYLPK